MTLSDNTTVAEGLGDFFMNWGKKGLEASKKWQKMFWKNLGELLKLEQTLILHLHLEALKQFYHHHHR